MRKSLTYFSPMEMFHILIFYNILKHYLIVPYFYFDSKEECQKKMRQKLKECHRQYNEWSRNYLNEGHQAPKYRKNGNAFAEGNFVR